jgi:Putative peptidoglycan binding domain
MRPYVVRQGDHLEAIAVQLGFDASTAWNDPKNEALRTLRKDPAILCPGDILYVPDPTPVLSAVKVGGTNTYTARVPMVPLNVAIKDMQGKPLAGKAYVIEGVGDPIEGTTDADGMVKAEVPATTPSCRVVLKDLKVRYTVKVGHLDPITEESGVRHRLINLGFLPSSFDKFRARLPSLERGLRAYQGARGLAQTGIIDDETRDALEKEHGT